jgi:hypothetical protein
MPTFTGKLYGRTGSQAVEGEMNRFIKMGVRHELPLTAVNNFSTFYVDLISRQRKQVQEMLEDDALLLTFHASLTCRNNIHEAANYKVTPIHGMKYNVTRIGTDKHQRVDYDLLTCTCEVPRFCGFPCPHMCAVYLIGTPHGGISSKHFVDTFSKIIPGCYRKEVYAKGYETGTFRPIMTCLEDDDTLPPPMDPNPRGQKRKSRFKSLSEGGFKKTRPKNSVVQTKKNKKDTMDAALLAEKDKPARALRQHRGGNGYGFGDCLPEEPRDKSLLDACTDLLASALISTGNALKQRQG